MSIPGSSSPLFFQAAAAAGAGAAAINSVRFNNDDAAHLSRTPSSAGNRKTWTFSTWCKQATPGQAGIIFNAQNGTTQNFANNFWILFDAGVLSVGDGSTDFLYSQTLRDPSAWYHIVVACDTTQSSASDRLKIYINGVEANYTGDSRSSISQNSDTAINSTFLHRIGDSGSYHAYLDGYLADVYFIDGQQLDPTSFGAFDDNGVWQAAAYSGSFGTNGFHLFDFANESGIGNDSSGNDNDFSVNNISSSAGAGNDVLFDVPTNGDSSDDTGAGGELSSNYAIFNPLKQAANTTLSNGNLQCAIGGSSNRQTFTNFGMSSGKWYCEFKHTGGSYPFYGISDGTTPLTEAPGATANSYAYGYQGKKWNNNTGSSYSSQPSNGDIIGVAFDADNGTLAFYKNGSSLGNAFTSIPAGTYFMVVGSDGTNAEFNAGQRAFAYGNAGSNRPAATFKALCTSNIPTPTILDGAAHFEAKLFTGNGSTNALTMANSSMSPDIVWIHARSTTGDHEIFDVVRGANKVLETNSKNAESTVANTLTSFDSNGFTLGSSSLVNDNNVTYVAWCWDAGSSNATNTSGAITSTVRANTTAGISIVKYTGVNGNSNVGHGLGSVPAFIVIKNRDASKNHIVYHKDMATNPGEKGMNLNETEAAYASSNLFDDREPTSSIFYVGTSAATNNYDVNYIALCFSEVAGFSSMGKYTSSNQFAFTGMRPAWVMIKRITNGESWVIYDTSRNTNNPTTSRLYSDLNNSEHDNTGHYIDILSNGFKVNSSGGLLGADGDDYLYVAFAENPFSSNGGLAR